MHVRHVSPPHHTGMIKCFAKCAMVRDFTPVTQHYSYFPFGRVVLKETGSFREPVMEVKSVYI